MQQRQRRKLSEFNTLKGTANSPFKTFRFFVLTINVFEGNILYKLQLRGLKQFWSEKNSLFDILQGVPKTWEFSDEFDIVFLNNSLI